MGNDRNCSHRYKGLKIAQSLVKKGFTIFKAYSVLLRSLLVYGKANAATFEMSFTSIVNVKNANSSFWGDIEIGQELAKNWRIK